MVGEDDVDEAVPIEIPGAGRGGADDWQIDSVCYIEPFFRAVVDIGVLGEIAGAAAVVDHEGIGVAIAIKV